MAIAIFGNKAFQVSSNKIYTFDGFTLTGSLETDTQEVQGKKPSTYIKGPSLEAISFSIKLDSSLGVNVLNEINDWRRIRDTTVPQNFLMGGKPVSSNKWLLKSVSISDAVIDGKGGFKKATVALELEEFVRAGKEEAETKKKAAAKKTKKEKSSISSDDVLEKAGKRNNPNASAAVNKGVKK